MIHVNCWRDKVMLNKEDQLKKYIADMEEGQRLMGKAVSPLADFLELQNKFTKCNSNLVSVSKEEYALMYPDERGG